MFLLDPGSDWMRRAGVTWPPGGILNTVVATALRTLCSDAKVVIGRPASTRCSSRVVKARVLKRASRPCCRRTERRRHRWKKHVWATSETCSRTDSSVLNSTPSFRTQLECLKRPTVTVLLFGGRRRSSDVEPNYSSSVSSAFNWSLFPAHRSATSAAQRSSCLTIAAASCGRPPRQVCISSANRW